MLAKLLSFGAVLIGCYAAFVAIVYLTQSRLVYFPTSTLVATPAAVGLPYQDVNLTTGRGTEIHGWYVRADDARWTVLVLHGNGGNISHRLDTLRIFHGLGADSLIVDYPGYGLSGGDPDEQGTYEAAMAAWEYLADQAPGQSPTVIFGRSLGGAVGLWLAARVAPAGVIVESTFTSVNDMGRHHYPFLPVGLISRFEYDALGFAARVSAPVLSVHSVEDEIVPYEQGVTLHRAFPGRKAILTIRGGHNDGFLVTGGEYVSGLKHFLESL